jgi:hypothetical protein
MAQLSHRATGLPQRQHGALAVIYGVAVADL